MLMTPASLRIAEDFKLSGLKFSNELIQFNFLCHSANNSLFSDLLAKISAHQINLPFIRFSSDNSGRFCFCVESSDESTILQLLSTPAFSVLEVDRISRVGIIALFPHRSSFAFLGQVIDIFSNHQIPIYAIGSTVSAISVCTDYSSLDHVAEKIQLCFPLPENHAPFRQELYIEQVVPESMKRVE